MVVGFNHNFSYKGAVYHIQTEDSGRSTPHIITLLYRGGNILASKKTSYADIIKVDNLEQVVEDLMKEQHKEMLRRLKGGEFDAVIAKRYGGGLPAVDVEAPPVAETPKTPVAPLPDEPLPPRVAVSAPVPPPALGASPGANRAKAPSLDDLILSYLVGEDK